MTAGGSPACTPAPAIGGNDRFDGAAGLALVTLLGRRRFLQAAAGGTASLLLAACAGGQQLGATTSSVGSSAASVAVGTSAASGSAGTAPWVYAFNVGSQDVTIIDSATHKVLATRPLGAAVRWLSNEQRYWDGQYIWTYDFPQNKLQAIVIDPKAVKVVKTIDTGTAGPGHSLMLTPDKQTALLNAAGSDVIDVIDTQKGQVTDKIATGKFP